MPVLGQSYIRGLEEGSAWDAAMQRLGMRAWKAATQRLGMRAGPGGPARGGHRSPQMGALVDRVPQLGPQRGGVIWASC